MERDLSLVLLDTSALIYLTASPDRLSSKAVDAIESSDLLFVSSISFWEIGIKEQSGRLVLPMDLDTFVERTTLATDVQILPVDLQVWMGNVYLDWDNRDPADRTIVATAQLISLPIVTSDRRMHTFDHETIW